MKKKKVILVFGRICSGKSTFMSSSSYCIVVSNIVKDLVNSNDRSVLQNTLDLDERIAEEIVGCLDALTVAIKHNLIESKNIIVDGIRQPSIVNYILEWYSDSDLVWIEAPAEVREARYKKRGSSKDTTTFEEADNKPIELECQKIYSIFKDQLQIINNY